MKVLLVNPGSSYQISAGGICAPLGLLSVAASIKHTDELIVLDIYALGVSKEKVVQSIKKVNPDVIGIICWMDTFPYTQWLTEVIKEIMPDVPVVLGGPFATVASDLYINHTRADVVVIGEGEEVFPEWLASFDGKGRAIGEVAGLVYKEDGVVKKSPVRVPLKNLDMVPVPPFEVFPMESYLTIPRYSFPGCRCMTMTTSRGCAYGDCSFCHANYLGRLRLRGLDRVSEEIAMFCDSFGVTLIYFGDATIYLGKQRTTDFCKMIASFGIQWCANIRANQVNGMPKQLLQLMYQSGCRELWIGFESASQYILNESHKGTTIEQHERVITKATDVGIRPVVFVLIGLPGETETTLQETLSFVQRNKLRVFPNMLFPIYGTSIWDLAEKQGKVPSLLEFVTVFSEHYNQSERTYPVVNLTEVSDKRLTEAMIAIMEHNEGLVFEH